ncbi:MAG: SpoIIE family protein phosphatase, partial [Candidatus Omnitrophica bacterium]|nr:SpoIIE family protein phosphatase [Candidatus Omnitrophota bacterium]
ITIFLAILDTQTGELYYSNAGHNPPFIRRSSRGIEILDKAKSLAIGLDERTVFEKEKVVLQAGDLICLYTDGVTEAFNEGHEQFSEERLKDALLSCGNSSMEGLVKCLLKEIKSFSKAAEQSDDITLLALSYRPPSKKQRISQASDETIIINNDIAEIPKLKNAWVCFAKKNGLSGEIVFDISLALEEAVSNIIYYGYEDIKGHQIAVSLGIENDAIFVRVSDDARPFNLLERLKPDIDKPIEEREAGGMGIFLIRSLMNEVEYRREKDKNILIMKKLISVR